MSPGGEFTVGEKFAIHGLVSEMELFLHGSGEVGCYFVWELRVLNQR